jgi:hypothetical protein
VKHWLGLTQDEIVAVLQKHFQDYRRFHTTGAGEQHFGLVQQAIRKALEEKHPSRDHADDGPERPPRKRSGGVRKVHHAGGYDLIDDRDDGESP